MASTEDRMRENRRVLAQIQPNEPDRGSRR